MPLDGAFFKSGLEWVTNKTYVQVVVNPLGMGLVLLFIMYVMLKFNDTDISLKTAFYLMLFLSAIVWIRDKMVMIRLKETNSNLLGAGIGYDTNVSNNSNIKPRNEDVAKSAYLANYRKPVTIGAGSNSIHPASIYTAADIANL